MSFWCKRSRTDAAEYLFVGGNDVNNRFHMNTNASGTFQIEAKNGGSQVIKMEGGPVLRDVSAWYHFVLRVDTTQATASDRVRLYKNGELVTFNSNSYPSQNTNLNWNVNDQVRIGRSGWTTNYFSGYMAEFINVDGQSLGPTSFGEVKSGIWIPSDYSGSYGTNGFKLAFQDSGALGDDTSGNGHDFTSSGLAAHDQMPDSPTNNFTTFPKDVLKSSGYTQHLQGNLQLYQPSWGGWDIRIASSNMPASGKYYWEVYPAQGNFPFGQGGFTLQFDNIRGKENMSGFPQFGAPMAYFYGGVMSDYRVNPGWVSYTRSGSFPYTVNSTVLQVAVDCDNNKIWYGINNSWMGVSGTTVTAGTGNPATGANGQAILGDVTDYVFGAQCADQSSACRLGINFGQDSTFAGYKTAGGNADENDIGDFQYAPPSGFLSLCSANMPELAIDPANDETPEDYFNTLLYTGNGANGRALTGVGFQSDWTWIKSRSAARDHKITDSVRGVNKEIGTQSFGVEVTRTNGLSAFGSDGFTVGSESGYNNSGDTLVAWNWKAGGTAVSNTDGNITSQVSANTAAGFSIVTYSGNSTGSQTVGHGLGKALDCVIVKARTGGNGNWAFSHTAYADTSLLTVDTTQALSTGAGTRLQRTTSTSTFLVGDSADYTMTNASGWTYVAYCFHDVEGYSKFGEWVGNGSTDGSFIYTGFRPAFVMLKRFDAGNNWHIADNKRQNPFNVVTAQIYPNGNGPEAAQNDLDFVS
ncbi:hypothetical protein N9X12_09235, partial [Alphaproteobacteria bacterium]|nr:hypothetical protein [Alphaproteobacteria bacterium]